jgi:TonB family protein
MPLRTAARVGLCALLVVGVSGAAVAQQKPPSEQELLARAARQPAEVSNYLELAKLYTAAQRYAEAEDMLARAIAVVHGVKQAQAPAPTGAAAAAPQPATEQDLMARVSASPNSIPNHLDLAKFYADGRRFADSEQSLTRAVELVRRARLGPAGASGGQAPLRVGGDIAEPKKVLDVKPVYPEAALKQKISGIVIMEAIIDTTGAVRDAKVLRSQPLLDQAAIDAVKQWRFTPTLLNGAPVEVIMTVTVNFTFGGI